MYCCSAITIRRAMANFVSSLRLAGSSPTMRLCSRANSVWVASSAMFSLARTSPAVMARPGWPMSRPSMAMTGAVAALPRASRRGSRPSPSSSRRALLLLGLPSLLPTRSQSRRASVPP